MITILMITLAYGFPHLIAIASDVFLNQLNDMHNEYKETED
jgi:hypothetical protein